MSENVTTSSDPTKACSDQIIEPEIVEHLPAVIRIVRYIVICVALVGPPKAIHAYNDEDLCRMLRELYAHNDQQYLFVIRNGELGKIYKTPRGLGIRFKEAGLKLKIPLQDRYKAAPDGWIGE